MTDPLVLVARRELLRYLSVSGLFITVALSYTGGLQGTGDTRSPLYISIVSQVVVPLGLCTVFQATRGLQAHRHLAGDRRRPLHARVLSVMRFRQQKWRNIAVDIEPPATRAMIRAGLMRGSSVAGMASAPPRRRL